MGVRSTLRLSLGTATTHAEFTEGESGGPRTEPWRIPTVLAGSRTVIKGDIEIQSRESQDRIVLSGSSFENTCSPSAAGKERGERIRWRLNDMFQDTVK